METLGALLGLLGIFGTPIAVVFLIFSVIKKKEKMKKYSLFAIVAGILFFTIAMVTVDTEKTATTKNDNIFKEVSSSVEKREKKKTKSSAEKKAKQVEKEAKESVKVDSTKEDTKDTVVSSSSEEVFDPNKYQVVDYNEWNHDKVEYASKVQVTGTVIQAMKSDEGMNLRLAINDDYDKVVLVTIENSDYKDVIAEDDNVTVYGLNAGLTSYETVMGNEQTIPGMLGTDYTVNSYGQ